MGVIIAFILGEIIGVVLICCVSVNKKDAVTVVKMFRDNMEHERVAAIKENKNIEYINGMSSIIGLYDIYFEEELQ